jgi:hypothetical protein
MTSKLKKKRTERGTSAQGVRNTKRAAHKVASDAPEPPLSKLDTILTLLRRENGASLAELVKATGWQPHSVRGALAGSLKRKGHAVVSEKRDGERRYLLK